VGRQIIGAIFLLVMVKLVESIVTDPVRNNAALWPLVYLQSVFGLGAAITLLWIAAKPRSRRAIAPPPGAQSEQVAS